MAAPCKPVDFLELPLNRSGPYVAAALTAAYPDLKYDGSGPTLVMPDGQQLPVGPEREVPGAERLANANITDQFHMPYPLEFDLQARLEPYFDPGRFRNDAFFRALYFDAKPAAQKTLVRVNFGQAGFQMTEKYGVDCQLAAVFAELEKHDVDYQPYFRKIGGSFNWRKISGTTRLSAHSFGIAVDLNTELGQYWKWSGAQAGEVGAYNNKIPESLVRAFEKYGFIWGGKWHHFDGMHFEYRPELILYSRLLEKP